jgi:hypothetical protein
VRRRVTNRKLDLDSLHVTTREPVPRVGGVSVSLLERFRIRVEPLRKLLDLFVRVPGEEARARASTSETSPDGTGPAAVAPFSTPSVSPCGVCAFATGTATSAASNAAGPARVHGLIAPAPPSAPGLG